MDIPEPKFNLGGDDLDASLPDELLTLPPLDDPAVEPPTAVAAVAGHPEAAEAGWEPEIASPLFQADEADTAGETAGPEAAPLTLAGGVFEVPDTDPMPFEPVLGPGQDVDDAGELDRSLGSEPDFTGSLFRGHEAVEAGDPSPAPVLGLPEGVFGPETEEAGAPAPTPEDLIAALPATWTTESADGTATQGLSQGQGPNAGFPPFRKPRGYNLSYGALSRRPARMAAAGVTASALMAVALALQPGSDAPRQVESGLPRPTLGTVPRINLPAPLSLVPAGVDQPVLQPDTPAPGGTPEEAPASPALGPGPPGTVGGPASPFTTAPRTTPASPGFSAGPSGPGPAGPQPTAAAAPAPACLLYTSDAADE